MRMMCAEVLFAATALLCCAVLCCAVLRVSTACSDCVFRLRVTVHVVKVFFGGRTGGAMMARGKTACAQVLPFSLH
jgi:hypothetical protein